MPLDNLPASPEVQPVALPVPTNQTGRPLILSSSRTGAEGVPRLIADAGDQATLRFINFFTAEIENDNTRSAYFRAIRQFDDWCGAHGLALSGLQPFVVAAYAKELKESRHPQTVKQHLAALRMLFDNLVVGQVLPLNPAASVKGPRYSTKKGKTPVLTAEDTRTLLNSITAEHVVGLRDRALISLMVFSFARISAAVHMRVEDFYPSGRRWKIRLHEKAASSTKFGRITTPRTISTNISKRQVSRRIKRATLPHHDRNLTNPHAERHDPPRCSPDGQAPRPGGGRQRPYRMPHLPGHGNHHVPEERRQAGRRPDARLSRVLAHDWLVRPAGRRREPR